MTEAMRAAIQATANEKKIREVAVALTDIVNTFSPAEVSAVFADEMLRQHRTLQQSTFRLFVGLLAKWDEQKKVGNFDMRNEAAVTLSGKMLEAIKDDYIPYL